MKLWDRQTDETDEWYERFSLYLYMGPRRTVADAHRFLLRLVQGAAGVAQGPVSSWRRAAQRYGWRARAAAFDAQMQGRASDAVPSPAGGSETERVRMVAELLQQVYGVLRHADLLTLSKEEARELLPTLRLFFRDLLHFYQHEAAQVAADGGTELRADDFAKFVQEMGGLQRLLAEANASEDESAKKRRANVRRDRRG
jgi:hypothetical protein